MWVVCVYFQDLFLVIDSLVSVHALQTPSNGNVDFTSIRTATYGALVMGSKIFFLVVLLFAATTENWVKCKLFHFY